MQHLLSTIACIVFDEVARFVIKRVKRFLKSF